MLKNVQLRAIFPLGHAFSKLGRVGTGSFKLLTVFLQFTGNTPQAAADTARKTRVLYLFIY